MSDTTDKLIAQARKTAEWSEDYDTIQALIAALLREQETSRELREERAHDDQFRADLREQIKRQATYIAKLREGCAGAVDNK